ncbi:hypothetical protein ACUV84_040696 [Puccinellia chinampoensis]
MASSSPTHPITFHNILPRSVQERELAECWAQMDKYMANGYQDTSLDEDEPAVADEKEMAAAEMEEVPLAAEEEVPPAQMRGRGRPLRRRGRCEPPKRRRRRRPPHQRRSCAHQRRKMIE